MHLLIGMQYYFCSVRSLNLVPCAHKKNLRIVYRCKFKNENSYIIEICLPISFVIQSYRWIMDKTIRSLL